MFCMEHVAGKTPGSRIRDVSIMVDGPRIQAVICPNINTIDEFMQILHEENSIQSGTITMDGGEYYAKVQDNQVAFITKKKNLYYNLPVADNIMLSTEKIPFFLSEKKIEQRCAALLKEVDYSLDVRTKVRNLSQEERTLVSILKAAALKPRLLVVDEIHGRLSYKGMSCFLRVLEMLKKQGTMILYFTSQWEDSVKIGEEVTVIAHGKTFGEYLVEDIKKNPAQIYHVMLGGERLKKDEKQEEFLQALSQGIGEIREGYDQSNMMKELAKRITKELKATHCRIYLIDEKNNSIMRISDEEDARVPFMKKEILEELNKKQEMYYFSIYENSDFLSCFEDHDNHDMETVLGIPIKSNGENVGVIQVFYRNYYVYSEKDRLYLELIGREIAMLIENSRLKGRSVLLQESHHRIKNNLQVIISLLQMEKLMLRHKLNNPDSVGEVGEMIEEIIGRIKSIATIHNILAHDPSTRNVADIEEIIGEIQKFYSQSAEVTVHTDKVFVPYNRSASLALVVNELINNSIKHARKEDLKIDIRISRGEDMIIIEYRDTGNGFPDDFDPDDQTGIGLMVIQSIVCDEFKGSVEFRNENGAYIIIKANENIFL